MNHYCEYPMPGFRERIENAQESQFDEQAEVEYDRLEEQQEEEERGE